MSALAKQRANPLSGLRQVTLTEQPNVGLPEDEGLQNLAQLLSLQYDLTYNAPRGWFLESNATITADWTTGPGDRWTVPVGGGFGKVFTVGKWSLGESAEIFYNVIRPSGGVQWSPSISFQLLFPD